MIDESDETIALRGQVEAVAKAAVAQMTQQCGHLVAARFAESVDFANLLLVTALGAGFDVALAAFDEGDTNKAARILRAAKALVLDYEQLMMERSQRLPGAIEFVSGAIARVNAKD